MSAPPVVGIHDKSGLDVARLYVSSALRALRERGLFADVRTYVGFIGYARSGHSLIGALLDAHPDAVVSHELDVLGFLERGFGRAQIYGLILQNARAFAAEGRAWTGYSYEVEGQWQGRFRRLEVIGDKRGARTTLRLEARPELLDRLRTTVGVPIRLIHVVRNPWDNIATRLRHSPEVGLRHHIDHHFRLCDANAAIAARCATDEVLHLQGEELIAAPRETLGRILDFLALERRDDYLDAAAALVYESPNKSRGKIEWDDESLALIAERTAAHPFLAGYSFDE